MSSGLESCAPSFGGASGTAAADRFSLLLLEDGEYYFRSHTAYHWPEDGRRVGGTLRVCSRGLYFVPRDVQQPIFRIPYAATTAIEALEEASPHGEDQVEIAASTRVDMRVGNTDAPYLMRRGDFRLRFSLVYASAEDVLPLVEELLLLAHRGGETKASRAEAAAQLADIVQEFEEAERFNAGWLEEEESVVAEAPASAVSPLAAQPGRAVLTQQRLYFQPFSAGVAAAPLQAFQLSKVVAVSPRVYQLEDLGLEVFFSSRHSLYLAFRAPPDRARFHRLLMAQPALQLDRMRSREQWTRDWVGGRISNFDYLMHLNREAGRSFKDLSQYPVMPWVVADYASPTLDLLDPATYRDLSKPIGALNPTRLEEFRQRYAELKSMAAPANGRGGKPPPGAPPPLDTPPFLYGCHYSSPGYVVFYLMRSDPQLMLRLQNGRFDAPDRLFWSIADTWKSVLSLPSDVKELVPEFYSNDPSFLLNLRGIDFGSRSGGQRVGDVALPPWAADARDFLYKLQEALESPHVSARLHKWIDLVFGRKSRGPAAERADNVFHYLTYDEIALRWLESEDDPAMRDALRLQMMEFGRTPRQLFTRKHPKRKVLGRGGVLSCFGACFAPPAAAAPRPATNLLTGKPFDARTIPPVSRAVFKLSCTAKREKRDALLSFLEQTAASGEPDALALRQTRGAELFVLVKAARDAREGRPGAVAPADEMLQGLVRAAAALATCPQNRRYLLEAGCLEPVGEALGSGDAALAATAAQALALMAQDESPRLAALGGTVLGQLLRMLHGAEGAPPLAPDVQLAVLSTVTSLSESYPAHRSFFAREGLLDVLMQQLQGGQALAGPPAAPPTAGNPPDSPERPSSRVTSRASLLWGPQRAEARAMRRRSTMGPSRATRQASAADEQAPHVSASLLRRQQLLALAVLLLDDSQKEALLADPAALPGLLADCAGDSLAVRSGAFECLASLTASDAMRQHVKELHLMPLLLEGAAATTSAVQQPAAQAVAHMCADPGMVLAELGEQPGLAPVVALALSPDSEVQRCAAQALWHLSVHPGARAAAVGAGALNSLLSLAQQQRNVAARDLSRQALLRCCDGEGVHERLEAVAAAAGLEPGQLAAMLSPSSARSFSSFGQRKARHRKMCSEVPSSTSAPISRTSSLRSAAESPAMSTSASPMAPAATAAAAAGAPPALSPFGLSAAAAAPANGTGSPLAPRQQSAAMLLPAHLQIPESPLLPLPIITPVGREPDSPPPAASATTQRQLARVTSSKAAAEAAAMSPQGAVADRVRSLEQQSATPNGNGAAARKAKPA